eukprot:2378512-Rhodomonas_salina.2
MGEERGPRVLRVVELAAVEGPAHQQRADRVPGAPHLREPVQPLPPGVPVDRDRGESQRLHHSVRLFATEEGRTLDAVPQLQRGETRPLAEHCEQPLPLNEIAAVEELLEPQRGE